MLDFFPSPDQNEEACDEKENSGRTKNHVLLEDLPSQEPTLSEEGVIFIRQNMEEEAVMKENPKPDGNAEIDGAPDNENALTHQPGFW